MSIVPAHTPSGTPRSIEVAGPDFRHKVRLVIRNQTGNEIAVLVLDPDDARALEQNILETRMKAITALESRR